MAQQNDPFEALGPRGLVLYGTSDDETFEFVNESTWRSLPSHAVSTAGEPWTSLATYKVALARIEQSVYVDLDQLKPLELTTASSAARAANDPTRTLLPTPAGRNVVLKELDRLYVVPEDHWAPAEVAIGGDAAVLINRGAVLAPIPNSAIAEGTYCVLINLAALSQE